MTRRSNTCRVPRRVQGRRPETRGGVTFDPAEGAYAIEKEALDPIGAEIVELPAKTEEEFIARWPRTPTRVIARNRRITAAIIKGLKNCKVIGLGSVGADTVDVDAATEAGIVVTNVPDVFIDEVADHTMAMFLAAHRRLRLMHQLTVDAKWTEGRPYFKDIPRLYGQTIGLISFGNVAKAVARRCHAFGLHVIAYDPYPGRARDDRGGGGAGDEPDRAVPALGLPVHARAAQLRDAPPDERASEFKAMKKIGHLHQQRPRAHRGREGASSRRC